MVYIVSRTIQRVKVNSYIVFISLFKDKLIWLNCVSTDLESNVPSDRALADVFIPASNELRHRSNGMIITSSLKPSQPNFHLPSNQANQKSSDIKTELSWPWLIWG